MHKRARLFIVDPMCVLNYGHNPQSLIYFSNYFSSRAFDCIPVTCRYFSAMGAEYNNFVRHFGYYYEDFVPLPDNIDVFSDVDEYLEDLVEVASIYGEKGLTNDVMLNQAILDWLLLFDKQNISNDDFIIFPSVDYYGATGLLHVLRGLSKNVRPQVHLRFIGVMENARIGGGDTIKVMRSYINVLHDCVTISAEAPVYCTYLESRLRTKVLNTVYPVHGSLLEREKEPGDPFIVLSAGAGRLDKGFLRLKNIVCSYNELFPNDNVIFRIQNLRHSDELHYAHYVSQLYAAPNIELMPAIQSDEDMLMNYTKSDIAIMPYDFETYKFRGSAVFMESLMYGRPFIISRKTGFDPLVSKFASAISATSDIEFCHKIHSVYSRDREAVKEDCISARNAYVDFTRDALGAVFSR